jgi:hypothetical protein
MYNFIKTNLRTELRKRKAYLIAIREGKICFKFGGIDLKYSLN